MYIDTEADQHVSDASENIEKAIQHISKVVIDRVTGSRDYNTVFDNKLKTTLNDLLEIRDRLDV